MPFGPSRQPCVVVSRSGVSGRGSRVGVRRRPGFDALEERVLLDGAPQDLVNLTVPVSGILFVKGLGGDGGSRSDFGFGTSIATHVPVLTNLPQVTSEVSAGEVQAGQTLHFSMKTWSGASTAYAFSTQTDPASVWTFTDTNNSLGWGGPVLEKTGEATWVLHLDDALSSWDDDDNDLLIRLRIGSAPEVPPVAVADTYSTPAGATLTVAAPGVLANDSDPTGYAMKAVLVSGPTFGSFAFAPDGSFTYTPAEGYVGVDHFTYYVNDGQNTSNHVTVSLGVRPQGTTTVSVTPSSPTPTYGDPLTFSAVVANPPDGPTPTGSVQFQVDGVNLGAPVALSSGKATSVPTTAVTAGPHTVTAVYSGSELYPVNSGGSGLAVAKAQLTVSADRMTKTYGDPMPVLTATFTGLVNGETDAVVSGTPALVTDATAASGVSYYAITAGPGTLSAANYDFTKFVNSTLQVTRSHLAVTADARVMTYGGAVPPLTATLSGFVNGDTAAVVSGTPKLATTATPTSPAGAYPITVLVGTLWAANYDVPTLVGGTLTVGKAHLTVTADDKAMLHGDPLPTLTATLSGFVNGDTAAVVHGAPALSTTATTTSPEGRYPITPSAGTLTAANYDVVNLVNGTLTVRHGVTVAVTPSWPVPRAGQSITFRANVTPTPTGAPAPGGTVQFQVNGQNLGGPISLTDGSATSPAWAAPAQGAYTLAAVYSGDATYQGKTASSALAVAAPLVAPTLALTTSNYVGPTGSLVTLGRRAGGYRWFDLAGKADPGVLVDLINLNNGRTTTTVAADASGNFTIALAGFYNGTYRFQTRSHDPAGNVSPSSPAVAVTLATADSDYVGANRAGQGVFSRTGADLVWGVIGLTGNPPLSLGQAALDVPLAGDFDADGKIDLVYYRPGTAQWYAERSAFKYTPMLLGSYGWPGVDIPVPADYNGDGMTDVGVYRPSASTGTDGYWYVAFAGRVNGLTVAPITTPQAGDVPVPGDYDNVGHAEVAVYRPGTGLWQISDPFSTAGPHSILYGVGASFVPVPGAYLATTHALQPAVFNTSTGQWFVRTGANTEKAYQFARGDIPAPGDYNGDGVTDVVVYRPSTGQWLTVPTGSTKASPLPASWGTAVFGTPAHVPLNAPYRYRQVTGSGGTISVLGAALSDAGPIAVRLDPGATAAAGSPRSAGASGREAVAPEAARPRPVVVPRGRPVVVAQPAAGRKPGQA